MRCGTSSLGDKLAAIRADFSDVIGAALVGYETAERSHEGGPWSAWPDLPIRLHFDTGEAVSVSWSKFDDLWVEEGTPLPAWSEGSTVRWVRDGHDGLNQALGGVIRSVSLGRGEMSVEGRDIEIWTRLLIEADAGWLEVFNALDENGYAFHALMPAGRFMRCV